MKSVTLENRFYFLFEFFVLQIYYNIDHESDLKPIKIPNCDAPCSLANFSKSVESIIIRDYDRTCTI